MLPIRCLVCEHLLYTRRIVLLLHVEEIVAHLIKGVVRVLVPALGIADLELLAVRAQRVGMLLSVRCPLLLLLSASVHSGVLRLQLIFHLQIVLGCWVHFV